MEVERDRGVAASLNVPLIEAGSNDFTPSASFTSGDTKIIKDNGTQVNTTNNPVHEGGGIYSLALTAGEMTADLISISIVDQTATKVWEDQAIIINAQTPQILTDIEQDTSQIGTAGAGLTDLGGMSTGMKTEVNTEVATVIVFYNLDHLMLFTATGTQVGSQSAMGKLFSASGVFADYDETTDSLQAQADRDIAGEVSDEVIEGSFTMRQYLRLFASALLGKIDDAGTTTNTFRDTGDTKDRITATVDNKGNRSAVTLDGS